LGYEDFSTLDYLWTRIGYVLIMQGLLSWVKAAGIQPYIKGSDYYPVYLDLTTK
jgi:exonuclease III